MHQLGLRVPVPLSFQIKCSGGKLSRKTLGVGWGWGRRTGLEGTGREAAPVS